MKLKIINFMKIISNKFFLFRMPRLPVLQGRLSVVTQVHVLAGTQRQMQKGRIQKHRQQKHRQQKGRQQKRRIFKRRIR
jgi:hypothetical protein